MVLFGHARQPDDVINHKLPPVCGKGGGGRSAWDDESTGRSTLLCLCVRWSSCCPPGVVLIHSSTRPRRQCSCSGGKQGLRQAPVAAQLMNPVPPPPPPPLWPPVGPCRVVARRAHRPAQPIRVRRTCHCDRDGARGLLGAAACRCRTPEGLTRHDEAAWPCSRACPGQVAPRQAKAGRRVYEPPARLDGSGGGGSRCQMRQVYGGACPGPGLREVGKGRGLVSCPIPAVGT